MSLTAFHEIAQLRFWSEEELAFRDLCQTTILAAVKGPLVDLNRAWAFNRMEGPMLTPRSFLSPEYDERDLWMTRTQIGGDEIALRPETRSGQLRYYEFTQMEMQCLYRADSEADYRGAVLPSLANAIGFLTRADVRIVPSDRLPSYAESTMDVEVQYREGAPREPEWREMCSVSIRKDFDEEVRVLEVAVGLDRLVHVHGVHHDEERARLDMMMRGV